MDHPDGHAFRRVTAAICVALFAALFICGAAAKEAKPLKGVALIVGQSQYAHVTPLANPHSRSAAGNNHRINGHARK